MCAQDAVTFKVNKHIKEFAFIAIKVIKGDTIVWYGPISYNLC